MYPETSSSGGYAGVTALCQPSDAAAGISGRIGLLIDSANATYNLLAAQHERLFGPVPARPEPINSAPKLNGPPTAIGAIEVLDGLMDGIEHVTRCIAERV